MAKQKTRIQIIKQNVGVDISKDDFKLCFYYLETSGRKFIKASRTFKNNLAGFQAFLKWIEKKRVPELEVRVTLESTGVYYEHLTYFLDAHDYYVSVVLPNQSKAYATSLNQKSKTDKEDARMLGQMGIERDLSRWQTSSPKMRILKQLTRDRVSLIDEKTALSNKLHALDHSYQPHSSVVKRMKQRLKLIKKQVKLVEEEITLAIDADPVLREKVKRICQVKGLGLITVAVVIAETNGFALFTSRGQLTSYAGYDVVQRESGTSIKGPTRISKKGNHHIRRALHFPAISMVKHEPHFKQIFERILDRTAIKMKAYVAVQRKALVLIYTLFKTDAEYNPNYHNEIKKTAEEAIQEGRQDTNPAYTGCLL